MSIPFSNTHYRIPRGFANLLEGLTREVLREQPQNIPHFAARYFAELLKKREESGFDPAEWGAALEDRYYNNHSFQHTEDKTFTIRTENIVSNTEDVQLSQVLTPSNQEKEEDEHKLLEESTFSAHTEYVSDRRESIPVLDNLEDTLEPHHLPSSFQLSEVENKQEKSVADNLLQEQSATVIQAAFRGHQIRQEVRKVKETESGKTKSLPLQEYSASEEADQHQDKDQRLEETGSDHAEEIESPSAEIPQEVCIPVQPHNSNVETSSKSDDTATMVGLAGGETSPGEVMEAQAEQTQDPQDDKEQKEDNQENPVEVADHDGKQTPGEEDNVAIKEDFDGLDIQQTHNEEPKEDDLDDNKEDTQNHRAKDMVKEDDGEGSHVQVHGGEEQVMMESQGPEAAEALSTIEEPDTSLTQEVQNPEAKTTEGQQESSNNQSTDPEDQLEDIGVESAETTPKTAGEQQTDSKNSEENEALRKQTDEALDIALDDPDANAAAAKIQAGFRGHMTRKKMKSGDKDVKHKEGKGGSSAQGEHEGD